MTELGSGGVVGVGMSSRWEREGECGGEPRRENLQLIKCSGVTQ